MFTPLVSQRTNSEFCCSVTPGMDLSRPTFLIEGTNLLIRLVLRLLSDACLVLRLILFHELPRHFWIAMRWHVLFLVSSSLLLSLLLTVIPVRFSPQRLYYFAWVKIPRLSRSSKVFWPTCSLFICGNLSSALRLFPLVVHLDRLFVADVCFGNCASLLNL